MGPDSSAELMMHEYGHAVHFLHIGPLNYISKVAVPSVMSFWLIEENPYYESQPWEYIAEYYGGLTESKEYWEYADELANLYALYTKIR